ncbi:tetratricopeptide repeat protein [Thermoactinospora rubra]|uniref:tetratricopeptide repeat protein n=1 Tax=Thermoactinospora rubra TaxID=1088767 RepID=UPI000A105BC7|nr:tetratricopeptide repeat protein [Thermoactinospora rubra]
MTDDELTAKLEELLARLADNPDDPELNREVAYAHDRLGLEHQAVPYYEKALALGASDRLGTFTGYGSTLRIIGRYEDALRVFDQGLAEFPGDPALRAFRAMALYNTGRSREAVADLLRLLVEAERLGGYERAVAYYAENLDETI